MTEKKRWRATAANCWLDARTLLAVLTIAWPADALSTEWWGRKLPDIPTHFIFGYGSLISSASRNATAVIPAIPVRIGIAFGYCRAWNYRSSSGFTALGLRKVGPGEAGCTINGVLYPAEGDDMSKFDAREVGYARVEAKMIDVEAIGWQRLPENAHVWVYVPVRTGHVPGEGLPEPDAQFPLLQSYIDVVIEGGLEYGVGYASEILATTHGWSRYWLNDREFARRPWVHTPKAAAIDALLSSTEPVASTFPDRRLPGPFAVRWLMTPAQ